MNPRIWQWCEMLAKHRPPFHAARRLFACELIRLAGSRPSLVCAQLGISRGRYEYARRQWEGRVQLSGPQAEAIRQLARELQPLGYVKAVNLFRELLAAAALQQTGRRHDTAAALKLHRNSLRRILRDNKFTPADAGQGKDPDGDGKRSATTAA